MASDDATRLLYAEMLGDEKGRTTAHFLIRALRLFRAQGIGVDWPLTDGAHVGTAARSWPAVLCPATPLLQAFQVISPQTGFALSLNTGPGPNVTTYYVSQTAASRSRQ